MHIAIKVQSNYQNIFWITPWMIEDIISFPRNVRFLMLLICCLHILFTYTPLHLHLNVDTGALKN